MSKTVDIIGMASLNILYKLRTVKKSMIEEDPRNAMAGLTATT